MSSINPYVASDAASGEASTVGNLRNVYTGVSLVYYGLVLWVACIVGSVLLPILLATAPSAILATGVVLSVLLLASTAMAFVGRIFCLSAPEQGARRLIYAAVFLDVLAMLIVVAEWLVTIPSTLGFLPAFLGLVANILFVLFLKTLASSLQGSALAQKAGRVLKLGVAIVVTAAGAIVGLVADSPVLTLACSVMMLVLALALLIYYASLLSGLTALLRSRSAAS